jgi:hypothetical protein
MTGKGKLLINPRFRGCGGSSDLRGLIKSMNEQQRLWFRLGVLTELVGRAPCPLGRTAVMKLAYFLQVVKRVPLGYNFRMYTYGPFESDVLNDLGQAETLHAVQSRLHSQGGYGYEFSAGTGREAIRAKAGPELAKYDEAIEWALAEFGAKSAADLELLSTIIYADRDACRQHDVLPFLELRRQVKSIKPRFSDEYIMRNIESLAEKGMLSASKSW